MFNWFKRKKTTPKLREVSHDQPLSPKNPLAALDFREVELSDCEYGCKIYESSKTGERVLAHNSAYGCYK